jgi:hypothetical protein
MVWGILKGCHVTDGFIRHSVCDFYQHHCLDADGNTRTRVFVEVGEEFNQLVNVGKWLMRYFLKTAEKIVKFDFI